MWDIYVGLSISQVQLLVSDSDVESYKQIKSDLDVLRQSVEKSELWVYKAKSEEEHAKNSREDEDDAGSRGETKSIKTKSIGLIGKQDSAIDLDIGPPIHSEQAEEYKKIQQVRILCEKHLSYVEIIDFILTGVYPFTDSNKDEQIMCFTSAERYKAAA